VMEFGKIRPEYIAIAVLFFGFLVKLYTVVPILEYLDTFSIAEFIFIEAVYLIGMFALALSRNNDLHRCLFVGSLVYSIIYFITAWDMLFKSFQYYDNRLEVFVEGILMIAVGLLMIYNIVMYIRKLSSSTAMIFYALIASLVLEIILLISSYRDLRDIEYVIRFNWDSLPNYLLCIYLLVIVNKTEIKRNTQLFSVRSSFRKIEKSTFFQGLTVDRSVVGEIRGLDGSNLWCDRYEFLMNSYEKDDYKAVMIKDGDRTHVTITNRDDTTGMNGYRFDLRGVVLDTGDIETCDTVRLYDEDGYFVQMIVSEEYVDRSREPSLKERLMSR
jgi:uncharacterized membrane protein